MRWGVSSHQGKVEIDYQAGLTVIATANNTIVPVIISFGKIAFLGGGNPPGALPAPITVTPDGLDLYIGDWIKVLIRRNAAFGQSQLGQLDFHAVDLAMAPGGGALYAGATPCELEGSLAFCPVQSGGD